jgi:hypothetical protein
MDVVVGEDPCRWSRWTRWSCAATRWSRIWRCRWCSGSRCRGRGYKTRRIQMATIRELTDRATFLLCLISCCFRDIAWKYSLAYKRRDCFHKYIEARSQIVWSISIVVGETGCITSIEARSATVEESAGSSLGSTPLVSCDQGDGI